jgi:hypothetical protein
MDQAYLNLGAEALALCNSIQAKVAELEALEAQIVAQDKAEARPSGTSIPLSRSNRKGVVLAVQPIPVAGAAGPMADSDSSMEEAEDEYEEYNTMSAVELLLKRSVKGSTMVKYGRLWDKWIFFAAYHGVDVMPPDMRGLEIFLADTAMLSGSGGVAAATAAAVAHFCALEGYISPFSAPRFSKILRGFRLEYSKPVKPKKPFLRKHIIAFMEFARFGSVLDWRAALPMALCFQQLLRGVEAFDLNGSNVVRHTGFFDVTVELSKNHITGFSFNLQSS